MASNSRRFPPFPQGLLQQEPPEDFALPVIQEPVDYLIIQVADITDVYPVTLQDDPSFVLPPRLDQDEVPEH